MKVAALLLSCEACGMTARVDRNDPKTFCVFVDSHYLPVIDQAEMDDGRLVDVVMV